MTPSTHRKNDILLICALLLLALLALGLTHLLRTPGGQVVVTCDGREILRLPLTADQEIVLEGVGGQNTLVISQGTARVTHADCPDGLCLGQGAIGYTGQTIVCLPHRLVISVEGGQSPALDGVSG